MLTEAGQVNLEVAEAVATAEVADEVSRRMGLPSGSRVHRLTGEALEADQGLTAQVTAGSLLVLQSVGGSRLDPFGLHRWVWRGWENGSGEGQREPAGDAGSTGLAWPTAGCALAAVVAGAAAVGLGAAHAGGAPALFLIMVAVGLLAGSLRSGSAWSSLSGCAVAACASAAGAEFSPERALLGGAVGCLAAVALVVVVSPSSVWPMLPVAAAGLALGGLALAAGSSANLFSAGPSGGSPAQVLWAAALALLVGLLCVLTVARHPPGLSGVRRALDESTTTASASGQLAAMWVAIVAARLRCAWILAALGVVNLVACGVIVRHTPVGVVAAVASGGAWVLLSCELVAVEPRLALRGGGLGAIAVAVIATLIWWPADRLPVGAVLVLAGALGVLRLGGAQPGRTRCGRWQAPLKSLVFAAVPLTAALAVAAPNLIGQVWG